MKIAMVFGKGFDGCGVQRSGVEFQNWAIRVGMQFDVFELVERSFARASGHPFSGTVVRFKPSEMKTVAKRLTEYDVVILQSIPSFKHLASTSISFYYDLVRSLSASQAIVVSVMNEIIQPNIDCFPLWLPILNESDLIYVFSEKVWFAQNITKILPSKVVGDRVRRFKIWTDVDGLKEKYFDSVKLADKAKRLTYVGRWSTMKDPRRVLDLADHLFEIDPKFQCLIHGIEKSIGAKADIVGGPIASYKGGPPPEDWGHHNTVYSLKFDGDYDFNPPKVPVFGPYTHSNGMRYIAESLFCASFFRLPKQPENYGDRMENTQIEMIACGSIPVFDSHYGAHNMSSSGVTYDSIDHLAIWSDKSDLRATAEKLVDIADNTSEQDKYRESGLAFIKSEFNSNINLPTMLDDIVRIGKDPGKFNGVRDFLDHVYGQTAGGLVTAKWESLISNGQVPAVGFKQFSDKIFSVFEGKKRTTVMDLSKVMDRADLSTFFND